MDFWGDGRARFLSPPPELLSLTLSKILRKQAKGVIAISLRVETRAVARLRRITDAVTIPVPKPGIPLVACPQQETERCSLMLA